MLFYVQVDREVSSHAGADGMFQLISVAGEDGKNYIYLFDQGYQYASMEEVRKELSTLLKMDVEHVVIEEE